MISVSLDWLLWIVGLLGFEIGVIVSFIIYHSWTTEVSEK